MPLLQFSSSSSSLSTPYQRAIEIVRALEPVRLAQVLLEFASAVGSQFWDGRRTGPDFVSPMTSVTKRQSGHLAKLILRHSKNLPNSELGNTDGSRQNGDTRAAADAGFARPSHRSKLDTVSKYQEGPPQAVVVLDLDLPRRRLESEYSIQADVHLMVLVPILVCLFIIMRTRQWSPASEMIPMFFVAALIRGPGKLTLIRTTAVQPAELDPDFGCAVLMDDNFTVVVRGNQKIVEAVTEGGFYISYADSQPTQDVIHVSRILEQQDLSDLLYYTWEGGCCGACEAIVMRLLHLHAGIPNLGETACVIVVGRMMNKACWWGSTNDSVLPVSRTTLARPVGRLFGEVFGLLIVATCSEWEPATTMSLHDVLLVVQFVYMTLIPCDQFYRIRTERLLDALGHPSISKWSFRTPASAATFVCLVLCRGIHRPVKSINVPGLLDTLISDQRDISRMWKQRVVDRILHEESITFAPTIPTFRDMGHQTYLKYLLDEAQSAYDKYHRFCHVSDVSRCPSTMVPSSQV